MTLFLLAILLGLVLLVWSAERFVEGAASMADHFGMPSLLIGMVVVGFGTSAPEIAVSTLASMQGNPDLAIGNAYGSNITNISLILGLTALLSPIAVESKILRKELPILGAVTLLAVLQLQDGFLSRFDAFVLLALFVLLLALSVYAAMHRKGDALEEEVEQELEVREMPLWRSFLYLGGGLVLLVMSSRMLVWGAVGIAELLGISSLIIGLTVVAVGTSLPELATSLIAARKGEHDLAFGNVLGSNLFNTLIVVGMAGLIHPFHVGPEVFSRDMLVMSVMTASLFLFGFGFRGPGTGRINRVEGAVLLSAYVAYTAWLVFTAFG